MNALSASIILAAADRAAVAAFRRLKRNLREAGQDVEALDQKFRSIQKSFRGGLALGAASIGMAKSLKPGIQAAGDLQTALKELKAESIRPGMDLTEVKAGLEEYKKMAARVQAQTSFDMAGVIRISTKLKKAGMTDEQILRGGGEAVAQLATAYKEVSPELAAEIVSRLSASMATTDIKGLANILAQVSASTTTNVVELYRGLVPAAPQAKKFGLTDREYAAMIATMQGRGIEGSKAGEAAKAFFARLAEAEGDPKKRAKLREFGIDPFDEKGRLKNIKTVINQFRKAMGKMTAQEQTKALTDLFGMEHASKLEQLFKAGAKSFEEVLQKSLSAANLETRVKIRLEGYQASLDALQGNIKTTLGLAFTPMVEKLKEIVGYLDKIIARVGQAMAGNKGLQKAVSYGTAAAIGTTALAAIGRLSSAGLKASRLFLTGRKAAKGALGRSARVAAEIAQAKVLETAGVNVQKVWVVNWPEYLGGGGTPLLGHTPVLPSTGSSAGSVGRTARRVGKLARSLRLLGRAATFATGPLGIVIGGLWALAEMVTPEELERHKEAEKRVPEMVKTALENDQTGYGRMALERAGMAPTTSQPGPDAAEADMLTARQGGAATGRAWASYHQTMAEPTVDPLIARLTKALERLERRSGQEGKITVEIKVDDTGRLVTDKRIEHMLLRGAV